MKTFQHNAGDYEIQTQGNDKYILYKSGKNKNRHTRHSLTRRQLDKELKDLGYSFDEFKLKESVITKSELRKMIKEELKLLNEKKIKGYSLVMAPKIGDEVTMGNIHGIVYAVATGGHTFKLKDEYGNKNTKDFKTRNFKKAKIVREGVEEWGKEHDKSSYDRMFKLFINTLEKKGKAYYKKELSNLTWKPYSVKRGRRFDKVIRENAVYCFVEIKTGDIYKAATWRAPAKGVRANLFDKKSWKNADIYGGWLYRR